MPERFDGMKGVAHTIPFGERYQIEVLPTEMSIKVGDHSAFGWSTLHNGSNSAKHIQPAGVNVVTLA